MNERAAAWAARTLRPPSSVSGLAGGSVAFAASMTPSLYPRPWLVQGLWSGIALASGYGLGAALGRLWRHAAARIPPTAGRVARAVTALMALAVVVAALAANHRWQLDVRALMGIDASATPYPFVITSMAAGTGYALVVSARLARAGRRAYLRRRPRLLAASSTLPLRVLAVVLLSAVSLDWVVGERVFPSVYEDLVAADARTDPGVSRPSSPYRSGGPGSLVAWDDLGRMGRRFVAQGPDATALAAFAGSPAREPIRVYVGLSSASSDRERARLAVAELERTRAFEREVLVVVTPTGTGGVNSFAIDPLEYIHGGDTAAVATQYTLTPSWMTMAGNQERAEQSAQALFDAVAERAEREPAASRPRVLLYGESLGAFGSESLVDDIDDVPDLIAGALWVGPPSVNRLRRELTEGRDAGSPVWQPTYGAGGRVRFGHDGAGLAAAGGSWEPPRIAYLQHASDPVVWWGPDLLLERPEWMREPRGPDVSRLMPYVPIVTFFQTGLDMVLGGNAPLGHGHMYGPEHAEAWAAIAPPADFSREDTRRLLAAMAATTERSGAEVTAGRRR